MALFILDMHLGKRLGIFFLFVLALLCVSCEKDIAIDIEKGPPEYIVEAYITNGMPGTSYVLLSRTVDYFDPDLSLLTVPGAKVWITEGSLVGNDTIWDPSTKTSLPEVIIPSVASIYINPTLQGKVGKYYLLEISLPDKQIRATTSIPDLVPLDSVTTEVIVEHYDNGTSDTTVNMLVHFNEPVQRGNNYRLMFEERSDSLLLGWGYLRKGDFVFYDDFLNGVYRHINLGNRGAYFDDTIQFYLNSIDRVSYNFWDSYESAEGNGGPFATPVQLKSNTQGAIGSFTGMAVSHKQLIVKRK